MYSSCSQDSCLRDSQHLRGHQRGLVSLVLLVWYGYLPVYSSCSQDSCLKDSPLPHGHQTGMVWLAWYGYLPVYSSCSQDSCLIDSPLPRGHQLWCLSPSSQPRKCRVQGLYIYKYCTSLQNASILNSYYGCGMFNSDNKKEISWQLLIRGLDLRDWEYGIFKNFRCMKIIEWNKYKNKSKSLKLQCHFYNVVKLVGHIVQYL